VNVHIIQCDSQIQSDIKLKNDDDFKLFIEKGEIKGFGGTDFRPVFSYVDELIEKGEFENLKGLIYFTDGYGVYPDRMPKYDVIFAFLNEDVNRQPVPDWAIKVVIEEDQL
jgi:predicted metal-dependent peptidase